MFFSGINAEKYLPLRGKLIIVDPGHGGVDPGTVVGNIYEKNLNLQISLKIKKDLEMYGAMVVILRDGDYDLASPGAMFRKKSDFDNRIQQINNSSSDIYLSIHMNYLNDSQYYGAQVFYQHNDEKLAEIIQKELNKVSGEDRKIKIIPNDTYMYKKIKKSGLLIECGFLSNSSEKEKLQSTSYQQQISKSIANGIASYFNSLSFKTNK